MHELAFLIIWRRGDQGNLQTCVCIWLTAQLKTDLQASISSIKLSLNEMEAHKFHIKIHQSLLQNNDKCWIMLCWKHLFSWTVHIKYRTETFNFGIITLRRSFHANFILCWMYNEKHFKLCLFMYIYQITCN